MIELTAADLSSEHLDKLASASWRDCWSQESRLKSFESVWRTNADGTQTLIQRTVMFSNGSITTNRPGDLKVRIYA